MEPKVSKRCQGIVSRVSKESFNGSKGIVSSIRFRVSKKLLDVSSTPKDLFNIFQSLWIDSLKYFRDAFELFESFFRILIIFEIEWKRNATTIEIEIIRQLVKLVNTDIFDYFGK